MFHPQLTPLPFRESVHPIVRVDSIAKILRSKIFPSEISNVEVFHYSIPNVQQVGNGKVEPGESIDSDKWLLTEEAVLISKLNPRKSTICVASKHKLTTVFSTEFIGLSTANTVDNKYLKYVLDSEPVRKFLSSRTTSATRSHQRVEPHEITALGIPWPDSQNRLSFVRELDRELAEIDEFIADVTKLQKLIEERELAELEKNLVESATEFVELRRFKPRCISGTSVNAAPWKANDAEFGVLKTGVVSKGYFDPSQNKAVLEESEISRLSTPVKANTIIVNRANSPELVGSAAFVEKDYPNLFLSDKLWQINFEGADNNHMATVMQTRFFKEQVHQRCVGASSSMQNLSYQDFLPIKIPNYKIVNLRNWTAIMKN